MDAFSDLSFFTLLMKQGSLAAAAQQMGVTPPSVSKRLAALEARLGVRLLHRTTRRIGLTPEGELYLTEGARVLAGMEALEQSVSAAKATPRGLLKVGATLGFGRRHVVPLLSKFARSHPEIELRLELSDRPLKLVEQGLDLAVCLGELPDARLTALKLASNRRVLCAAPAYLKQHSEPAAPRDLAQHRCIVIRESDETFGTWHLHAGAKHEAVKVRGPLSTNDGEAALAWALDGHGILLRSQWDAAPYLRSGRLRAVLPGWKTPPADIFAVYPTRAHLPAKTRALIDFLHAAFKPRRSAGPGDVAW